MQKMQTEIFELNRVIADFVSDSQGKKGNLTKCKCKPRIRELEK